MNIEQIIDTIAKTNLTSLTRTTFDYSLVESTRQLILKEVIKLHGSGNNKYEDISRGPHEQKSISRTELDRE